MPCSKRMRGCHRRCLHRERVQGYYRARDDQEARAEAATNGYETELASYFDTRNGVEQRVVFKQYLIDTPTDQGTAP